MYSWKLNERTKKQEFEWPSESERAKTGPNHIESNNARTHTK